MDHLLNPNHEYYKDFGPLNPNKDEKSESDSDPSSIFESADLDSSLFDTDLADTKSLGIDGSDSLFTLDSSADPEGLGDISWSIGDKTDVSQFLPNSDGSSDLGIGTFATIDPATDYSAGTGLGTDLLANTDSETDLWANTDPGTDLSFNLNSGTDFALNDDNLFAAKRIRRSSRDFAM